MNTQALEHALLLKKTRSFSLSARQSGLTQSAISQQIAKLEKEMGIVIFNRQTKPIGITSDGEKFLERAEPIILGLHQLKDFAEQLESEIRGDLTIGIMPTLAPYLTPLFIKTLKKRFPDLQLYIKEAVTEKIIEGIMTGELNAGLIATPIRTSLKLQYDTLFYERFFGYVSDKNDLFSLEKIDLRKIDNEDVWLLNKGNCFANQVTEICRFRPRNSRARGLRYGTDSIDSLRSIVELSGGVTFLPELAATTVPVDREDLVKELKGPKLAREISLVHTKGQPKLKLISKVVETIQDCLPKELLKKGRKKLIATGIQI